MNTSRPTIVLALLAGALAASCLARLLVGPVLGWPAEIFLVERLRSLSAAATVGAALATSGALLQALLRNPLASPYVLGLSTGATLGYLLARALPLAVWSFAWELGLQQFGALGGALATMGLVYALGQRRGWIDPVGLLLVGVVVNAVLGAIILFITFQTDLVERGLQATWLLGYFDPNVSAAALGMVAAITLGALVIGVRLGPAMDVAVFSDAEAHAMGLNLGRLRLGLFLLAGALTAGAVLLAGPIGFVGLVAPHLARRLLGPRHRCLVLASALLGAMLLVAADALTRVLSNEAIALRLGLRPQGLLPVGVLTALFGGPFFLFLLRPRLLRGGDA